MKYAEVSVNSPIAQRRTFSYAIPDGLNVVAGHAVMVPFGDKVLQGVVMELSRYPAVEDTREILETIGDEPVLSPQQLSLARYISNFYLTPLFDAVALMLPPGFERKTLTIINLVNRELDGLSLTDNQNKLLSMVRTDAGADLRYIEKTLGKRKASEAVLQLVKKGIVERSYKLEPVRMRPRTVLCVELTDKEPVEHGRLGYKQQELLDFLKQRQGRVPWTEVREKTGCSKATADSLEKNGIIAFSRIEVRREPIDYNNIVTSSPIALTDAQDSVYKTIIKDIDEVLGTNKSPGVYLLHGVTASGKTEIYLQVLAKVVSQRKKGIVLVPEIALTPQTIERFASRFPHRVAVFHSKLSPGEQYDEWHRIKGGEFDVVIGSRSAIFTPQPDLGVVIIDEEHEWTYKQDNVPHYHAREAAIKLAEMTGAAVILGSATPDVESYYKALNGEYKLLLLPERVVPYHGVELPQVEIVDMREELKAGNRSIFSRSLEYAINEAIAAGEQVILFLNRRGGASFVQCRRCGFVMRCRRCDVPLSYHIDGDMLTCHQCNYKAKNPEICPECSSRQIKYLGTGTQTLEKEVRHTFPRARSLRWDSDATVRKSAHEEILSKFRRGDVDILIGTQMVAKGLDIPAVTLVGVIIADTTLNLPDIRAGERTFQLISQVAGRAGRGSTGGRVIIQTYSPEHYAVQAAAKHDYKEFYKREIMYRRELNNPPFQRLARLIYAHTNDAKCRHEVERMKEVLLLESEKTGISGIEIMGPAAAFINRLRGRFRWQLILRGNGLSDFLSSIDFPQGWIIDIDPITLL